MRSKTPDWSPLQFAGDPTPGHVEAISALMDDIGKRASWLRQRSNALDQTLNLLTPQSWAGLAAEVFRERVQTVREAAEVADQLHVEAKSAVKEWGNAVFAIQFDADRARDEAEDAQNTITKAEAELATQSAEYQALAAALAAVQKAFNASLSSTPPPNAKTPDQHDLATARRNAEDAEYAMSSTRRTLAEAQERLESARALGREAKQAYEHAEKTFAATLDTTLKSRLANAAAPQLRGFRSGASMLVSIEKAGVPSAKTSMAMLTGLTPEQLKDALAAAREIAQQFWDHPPQPDVLAAWWDALDPATQEAYIQSVPTIIGNLPGIPFVDRDRANRRSYAAALKDPNLTEDQRRVLENMGEALTAPAPGVPVQIVSFNFFSSPPKLSIGYGNLDTCSPTTWNVGGMAFGAKDALADWSKASKNLWLAQQRVGGGNPGVVACFEYDNPDAAGVTNSEAAKKGAARFAAELDGNAAVRTRFTSSPSAIEVTAHSYGTTMAAIALTKVKTPIDAFVMVGSAGIDTAFVPSLGDLRTAHVYTTAATPDQLAPFGAAVSGRANPNPAVTPGLAEAIGGAQAFSSDGDGKGLAPVDGHNPIGKPGVSPFGWVANTEPSEGHGYYDRNTQCLWNLAAVTTDRLDRVSGSLTDTSRAATKHNQDAEDTLDRLTHGPGLVP